MSRNLTQQYQLVCNAWLEVLHNGVKILVALLVNRAACSRAQADVRSLTGRLLGKEDAVNLGRPQTPRKRELSQLKVDPSPITSILGNRSLACGRDEQLSRQAGTPLDDGIILSLSRSGSAGVRQEVELDSVVISMDGETSAKVNLADARKQLMMMGLFPRVLYEIGESFEEKRLRYVPYT